MGSRPGNPLDFLDEVTRNIKSGVDGIVCAVMRKPPPSSLILAGATVLVNTGANQVRARAVSDRVLSLGGRLTDQVDRATHCILREGLGAADLAEYRVQLEICQELALACK